MCQLSLARTNPGLVSLPEFVQLLHKIMNAKTVEAVGINRFKILATGNIDMWHHPKYYKELRSIRNKLDQAISNKLIRLKLQRLKLQAASVKSQAARFKLQATSIKLLDILPLIKFYLVKGEGLNHDKCILRMVTMK